MACRTCPVFADGKSRSVPGPPLTRCLALSTDSLFQRRGAGSGVGHCGAFLPGLPLSCPRGCPGHRIQATRAPLEPCPAQPAAPLAAALTPGGVCGSLASSAPTTGRPLGFPTSSDQAASPPRPTPRPQHLCCPSCPLRPGVLTGAQGVSLEPKECHLMPLLTAPMLLERKL